MFKDEGVLIFFIIVPLIYPLLYSWIYNNETVHEVPVAVVDQSHTSLSRQFIRMCDASADVKVRDISVTTRWPWNGLVDITYSVECDEMDDDGNPRYSEEKAEVPVYIVKPEKRNYSYNKPEELISSMDKVMVEISKIPKLIEKESGDWGKAIVDKARSMDDRNILKQLFRWPYIYGADFLPEFYFMHEWFENYPLEYPKLTKAFMDIETDMHDAKDRALERRLHG